MHTAKPFLPEPSVSEVEVAAGKLKRYKSPGVDQIPAELIQQGGDTVFGHSLAYLVDLEQRRIASPVERVNCGTYLQKG
jgi:hypothetical protein